MWFAGVDLGATFIKGAVLDLERCALRRVVRVPFPPFSTPAPPRREIEPARVLEAVRRVLAELTAGEPPCAGVVLSGQMHGLVLCDHRGAARSPFISWQDRRNELPVDGAGSAWERLRARLPAGALDELGGELKPSYPLTSLFRLREEGATLAGLWPAGLASWIAAALCGVEPTLEPQDASALGALAIASGDWHRPVLAALGLDGLNWPAIATFRAPVGRLPSGTPVYVAVGDQQASLLGVGLRARELSVNVATGSQVAARAAVATAGPHQTRPYFDLGFLRTVTHLPAGRAINAVVRLLTELSDGDATERLWGSLDARLAEIRATDLVVDLRVFPTALGDRGAFTSMHEGNLTVSHVLRACVESMARNFASVAQRLDTEVDGAVLSGGLTDYAGVREAIVRHLALPTRDAGVREDALTGLLTLGLVHGGLAPGLDAARASLGDLMARSAR